ncbi:cupin domain-containing protein [Nocardia pseudovaccinii]|uniref:cupin domain-containing protein n=1 Tax=Nocardia pseudovaccinii TaxID=189540 RepID=UPI003D8A6C55
MQATSDASGSTALEEGRAWWFFDALEVTHASFAETGGHLAFGESLSPDGSMPPLHVHPEQDEGFYVLEGGMRLYVGRDVIDLGPGQFALAPRAIPHTFRVSSPDGRPSRILGWITGPFDEFVHDVGKPAEGLRLPTEDEQPSPDLDAVTEAAAKRGIIILGPPGMLPTDLPEYQ